MRFEEVARALAAQPTEVRDFLRNRWRSDFHLPVHFYRYSHTDIPCRTSALNPKLGCLESPGMLTLNMRSISDCCAPKRTAPIRDGTASPTWRLHRGLAVPKIRTCPRAFPVERQTCGRPRASIALAEVRLCWSRGALRFKRPSAQRIAVVICRYCFMR